MTNTTALDKIEAALLEMTKGWINPTFPDCMKQALEALALIPQIREGLDIDYLIDSIQLGYGVALQELERGGDVRQFLKNQANIDWKNHSTPKGEGHE